MIVKPNLSRKAIRALRKGQQITEKGIKAEKLEEGVEGDVRYSINIMVDRERHHRIIGKASEGVTLTQAQQAIETLRTRAREERLDLPKGRKTAMSFAEAAVIYLDRLTHSGGKSLDDKRRHLERRLVPYFGKGRLDSVTDLQVEQYVHSRLEQGFKQATVNRELSTLSHFFNRAINWKWMKKDDKPQIAKSAEPRKPIAVLTDMEADLLMQAAVADVDPALALFVAFGLNTAMRHSEILKVRYEHIDFDSRRIFIPEAKAGEREQVITPTLASLLERHRQSSGDRNGWVFPVLWSGRDGHRITMGKQFKRAVVRAGLSCERVTPHVMRHTAITNLVRAGVDLPTIQKISGHKTYAMVLRYTHVHGRHLDEAISHLDRSNGSITQKLHSVEPLAEAFVALCSSLIDFPGADDGT
ncbi:tyrosine-type recombinase/integrase [Sphingobium yanoikuyae]|uniref:tyrosine-type recombinase/integrase n=1 Tax=Sphingobium yanoikuyae TaxID=13690 RepID=UPI0009BE476E|nr:site-specific integrase [Sphingobium yanoikuyae]